MKKCIRLISFAAAAAMLAVSCSDKDTSTATLSFEATTAFADPEASVSVRVVLSSAPAQTLTVPFTVGGTAEEGTDYTLSASSFTVAAGETAASIEVTNLGAALESKSVTLILGNVAGYSVGMNPQTVIAIRPAEKILYSFAKSRTRLLSGSSVEIVVNILGETTGSGYTSSQAIEIPFTIEESSTAAKGSDFTVKDNLTSVTIPAGQTAGSFTLVAGEFDPEAGLTVDIALSPAAAKFMPGTRPEIKVSLLPVTGIDELLGEWTYGRYFDEDAEENGGLGLFDMIAGEAIEQFGLELVFPTHNTSADKFTIEYDDESGEYRFTPSTTGDVSCYFRSATLMLAEPPSEEYTSSLSYTTYNTVVYDFSEVNFLFSKEEEELLPAKIRTVLREGKDSLDVFILNDAYQPTDFLGNLYNVDYFGDGSKWGEGEFCKPLFDIHYVFGREIEKEGE